MILVISIRWLVFCTACERWHGHAYAMIVHVNSKPGCALYARAGFVYVPLVCDKTKAAAGWCLKRLVCYARVRPGIEVKSPQRVGILRGGGLVTYSPPGPLNNY